MSEYQNDKEFQELLKIYKDLPERKLVLEIGSLLGHTLKYWMKYADPSAHIISVDKMVPEWDHRYEQQKKFHEQTWWEWAEQYEVKFTLFSMDSTEPHLFKTLNQLVQGKGFDFIFIDGGHDIETVASDFNNAIHLSRVGHPIALHDINLPKSGSKQYWQDLKKIPFKREEFIYSEMGIGVIW